MISTLSTLGMATWLASAPLAADTFPETTNRPPPSGDPALLVRRLDHARTWRWVGVAGGMGLVVGLPLSATTGEEVVLRQVGWGLTGSGAALCWVGTLGQGITVRAAGREARRLGAQGIDEGYPLSLLLAGTGLVAGSYALLATNDPPDIAGPLAITGAALVPAAYVLGITTSIRLRGEAEARAPAPVVMPVITQEAAGVQLLVAI